MLCAVHFTVGAGLLVNPVALPLALFRVWAVVYAGALPGGIGGRRRVSIAALAVSAAGIALAAGIESTGLDSEVQAALLLPWWLVFIAVAVWGEIELRNTNPKLRPVLAVVALPLLAGLLGLVYVGAVCFS